MGFSNNSLENLKNSINIVDVISSKVKLKKTGSNYKGLCPFHGEKTASFVVSEEKQIFTCFGCGASGDVISFVERYYNLDFNEAVERLAEEHGIKLERSGGRDYSEYYGVNKMAAEFFYKKLISEKNRGYGYLKERNVSDAVIKRFGLGFSGEGGSELLEYLRKKGISDDISKELGLINEGDRGYYDKFRGRVIFPIINTSGKVIGFGGRIIDKDKMPKYLNSPENSIFKKKDNLYALNINRKDIGKAGYLILVEGYMDVIGLSQYGIKNAVATLGTALTENQAKLISRYTKNVILSYDSDDAGINATKRGIDILRSVGLNVKVLSVDDGKDPDEFVKKHGRLEFNKLIDKALPAQKFLIKVATDRVDVSTPEGKLKYVEKVLPVFDKFNPVESEVYIEEIAREIGISSAALRLRIGEIDEKNERGFKSRKRTDLGNGDIENDFFGFERDAIKLATMNERIARKLSECDEFWNTEAAKRIFDGIVDCYGEYREFDADKIIEKIGEKSGKKMCDIISEIPTPLDEEELLTDCIKRADLHKLKKKQSEMLDKISLYSESSDEGESTKVREMLSELMEVQEEIRKIEERR